MRFVGDLRCDLDPGMLFFLRLFALRRPKTAIFYNFLSNRITMPMILVMSSGVASIGPGRAFARPLIRQVCGVETTFKRRITRRT